MSAGAALTAAGGIFSTMLQNDANVRLAQQQREYDRKMWYEQAAYQSNQIVTQKPDHKQSIEKD